jgi:actin-like ATPase involved in cell morphogenesis
MDLICFGIDFGTSNSCLAVYDGASLAVVDAASSRMPGARVYPSVVAFDDKGDMVAAGWQALDAPSHLAVDQVKRWIGKPYDEVVADPRIRKLGYRIVEKDGKAQVLMGSRAHTPEDIVTFFLGYVVREGLAYLRKNGIGAVETISVVVTYPAYYAQNQVDAIRRAVMNIPGQVGEVRFDGVRLIPEPTASVCAALYDGKLGRNDRYVMVIDEGAGTLDTLVVDMRNLDVGQVEARGISIGGQAMLGGSDMDARIMDWVLAQVKSAPGNDLAGDVNIRQLRARVESAKIDISEGRMKVTQVKVPGLFRFIELTPMHMDALVQPVIDRCEVEVRNSLAEIGRKYGIDGNDIGKVILVGGPTRMVSFRKMVMRVLPASEIVDVNPMECVAVGAAVSSAVPYRIPAERTYGLLRGLRKKETFVPLVRKDTPLPAGGIATWYVKAFEGVDIEPAQVLEDSSSTISCMTMGRYTFPAAATEQIYYIAFMLDDERNVRVVMYNAREQAEQCLEQGCPVDEGCFRLEFRREVSTRLIQPDHYVPGDTDRLSELFWQAGYGLLRDLRKADEAIDECGRIIAEFGTDVPETRALYAGMNGLEDRLNRVKGRIGEAISSMRGAGDAAAYEIFVQMSGDIRRSEDMLDLSRKTDELLKAIGSADLAYDRTKILELINRMSATKNDAWMKVRKYSNKLTPEALGSIESTVGELESIQRSLEPASRIQISSPGMELYRKGRIKEQELRNKIDNMFRQE